MPLINPENLLRLCYIQLYYYVEWSRCESRERERESRTDTEMARVWCEFAVFDLLL